MKFIAIILSTYILALTVIPCADDHVTNNSSSTEVHEQNHDQLSGIDLCSPFCFCNCCQSASQTTTYSTFQINMAAFELTTPLLVQSELECSVSFWRPPKI